MSLGVYFSYYFPLFSLYFVAFFDSVHKWGPFMISLSLFATNILAGVEAFVLQYPCISLM